MILFIELLLIHIEGCESFSVTLIERHVIFDVDPVAGLVFAGCLYKVADFALKADVRDNAMVGFRIDARHIACIRVSIGVAVFHVEKNHEIIPVLDRL